MLLLCAPVPPSPAEQAAVTLQCCCLFSQLFTKPSHVFERSHTDTVLCARHKPFSEPFLRHLFDFWRSGDQTGAGPASALLPALRPRGLLCSGLLVTRSGPGQLGAGTGSPFRLSAVPCTLGMETATALLADTSPVSSAV